MGALYGILGGADHTELRALGNRLAHRGREAAEWSPGRDLHLGIRGPRRIVDVQEHGPVAFDGAIDNRVEIARLLRRPGAESVGPAADAGLVFELVDSFGPEGLARLAGQFALAFWHGPERRLLLARDRTGYAPLYFSAAGDRIAFASEYKALLLVEGVVARPNRHALHVVHATGWAPPGLTCLQGVFPVAPGSCLEVRAGRISSRRYWGISAHPPADRDADPISRLRDSLVGALSRQVAGYGRIGISLSAGIDSALVAAGARAVAEGREIHTFTAGYGPDDHDLSSAAKVARALGARHHAVLLDPEDLGATIPWIVWHLEEPVGGAEAGCLFAAAREAASHVTLVMTGFGLDGLFGGQPRNRLAELAISLAGHALRRPPSELVRRDPMTLPRQAPFERLYSGAGIRLGAPHTDPEFVEAAFSIPDRLMIHRDPRKQVLRETYARLLPMGLATSRKPGNRGAHGLGMSDALDHLAVELLSPGAVRERGFFEPAYVTGLLRRPGGRPYGEERLRRIWSLLLTEIWARSFLDRAGSAPVHPIPPVRRLDGPAQRSDSAASAPSAPNPTGYTLR